MNVVNLPVGDMRVANFAADLVDFIRQSGDGLSYPAILGCIEIAKAEIMKQQLEDVL